MSNAGGLASLASTLVCTIHLPHDVERFGSFQVNSLSVPREALREAPLSCMRKP